MSRYMYNMEVEKVLDITPRQNYTRGAMWCQCELGREKLLTAPARRMPSPPPETQSRFPTAPTAREPDEYICPISHILVSFRAPLKPNEVFNKVFPAATAIKFVKRKLAKLLNMSSENLLLTKNRNILKDTTLLSELKTDALGNLMIDVFTIDSEELSLASIPKESYVHELLHAVLPKKEPMPFVAIKFRVGSQNATFTRSYHSNMKIHEVKKNLGELFQIDPVNLVFLRDEHPIKDRMALMDLDYNKYGIAEVELITKNHEKVALEKLYREKYVNDIINVIVPFGTTFKQINVEIFSEPMEKPFLGGYRNIKTGVVYHHAYTHTPQKPEKVLPENKSCRDTQTAEEVEKIFDTDYSRATQMDTAQAYIPSVSDRIIVPKPYETYDEMIKRLNHNHYATVIQRAVRKYNFRKMVFKWLKVCAERIARMKEEDRLEREAMDRRLRRDLITKTFPKTREDFDQLYAMVDRWKHAEIARISRLHAKGPKIAEFSLLLDKEVELLRCIEDYRVKVKEDSRKTRERKFLEEISKPVAWYGRSGKLVTMETIEIQKARKLKELYHSFLREDMDVKERMELLVDMKFALQDFRHPLAEGVISLLDQECDLLVRRCNAHQLEFLRRRVAAGVFRIIETSELNSSVTRSKHIRDYRGMEHSRLYLCELCHQVKPYTDFPLNTRMTDLLICKSCSWKDVTERLWIDMTPYRFILRAVQRDERRRKCWGSIAFVLQEKDVFFIVEKLWHSHSAISECGDITELRLSRWHVYEDWSPWNCFLVTVQEMKAHLKLECPEDVYDEELVQKIATIHQLAKHNFEQLMAVNKRLTESGDWHAVRAPAVVRADGVEPIE